MFFVEDFREDSQHKFLPSKKHTLQCNTSHLLSFTEQGAQAGEGNTLYIIQCVRSLEGQNYWRITDKNYKEEEVAACEVSGSTPAIYTGSLGGRRKQKGRWVKIRIHSCPQQDATKIYCQHSHMSPSANKNSSPSKTIIKKKQEQNLLLKF